MSTRRLSTVHDLASLRLHPDGTRVQNTDRNLRIRASKYAARDSKGNWFAHDAGGTGKVKQRWAKPRDEAEENENSTEDDEELPKGSKGRKVTEEREEVAPLKDPRARKRRRFYADESFIATSTSGAPSTQGSPKASSSRLAEEASTADWVLPTPTAETLKCMHYFACNYYTAMGQLRDSTKGSRHYRKLRRKQKLQHEGEGRTSEPPDEPVDRESSTDEEHSSSSESHDDEEEDDDENSYRPRAHRRRKRRASPDMYKALDGSALMAISMFVQEHIAQLLSADVPDEWDTEMEAELEAQRSKQAALNSVLASRHGRPSFKIRRRNAVTDQDDDAEQQPDKEKDTETPGRRTTRGIVLPRITVPFADDSSEDEDYIP